MHLFNLFPLEKRSDYLMVVIFIPPLIFILSLCLIYWIFESITKAIQNAVVLLFCLRTIDNINIKENPKKEKEKPVEEIKYFTCTKCGHDRCKEYKYNYKASDLFCCICDANLVYLTHYWVNRKGKYFCCSCIIKRYKGKTEVHITEIGDSL